MKEPPEENSADSTASQELLEIENEEKIVVEIATLLSRGQVITPFLGSGISAPSGILMGQEFSDYLCHTILLTLEARWNIRDDGWPEYPSESDKSISNFSERLAVIRGMIEERRKDPPMSLEGHIFSRAMQIMDGLLEPKNSTTTAEDGYRGRVDWTDGLQFLAQLKQVNGKLSLGPSESSVIDGFNAHITRGRRPNLNHTMLARLSRSFRSQIILTTNFDTLIEESFAALQRNLQVFAVSSEGALPEYSTVRGQSSLIKLHGDILETRADATLDQPPTLRDKIRFFSYLRGPFFPEERGEGRRVFGHLKSHLLVLGYSGRDRRCREFIEFALEHDPDFKVFWVCYGDKDKESLASFFPDRFDEDPEKSRIKAVVTTRADLFLYALYQRVNRSLPGGGFDFQYTHSVPPLTSLPKADLPEEIGKKLFDSWKKRFEEAEGYSGRITVFDHDINVTGPMRALFKSFERSGKSCIWLDLDDFSSVRNLAFHILSVISLRLGFFQLDHVNLISVKEGSNPWDGRFLRNLSRLKELYKIADDQWVVFLYGRNAPGACAGVASRFWTETDYGYLEKMMDLWASAGIQFVYMPIGKGRFKRNRVKEEFVIKELLPHLPASLASTSTARAFHELSLGEYCLEETVQHKRPGKDFVWGNSKRNWIKEGLEGFVAENPRFEEILKESVLAGWLGVDFHNRGKTLSELVEVDWNGEGSVPLFIRLRFLYAMTLFRQSRHPASLSTEATIPCPKRFNLQGFDNDTNRSKIVNGNPDSGEVGWIATLLERGVILKKPGGYAWKYRDMRVAIRYLVENLGPIGDPDRKGKHLDFLGQTRSRTHFWIGEWYFKAFCTSGHYIPLLECIYHRLQSLKWVAFAKPMSLAIGRDDSAIYLYRQHLAEVAILETIKAARIGRESLKFWLSGTGMAGLDLGESPDQSDGGGKPSLRELLESQAEHFGGEVGWVSDKFPELERELLGMDRSIQAEGGLRKGKKRAFITFPSGDFSGDGAPEVSFHDERIDCEPWLPNFFEEIERWDLTGKNRFSALLSDYLEKAGETGSEGPSFKNHFSNWKARWVIETLQQKEEGAPDSTSQDCEELNIGFQPRLWNLVWVISEFAYALVRRARMEADCNAESGHRRMGEGHRPRQVDRLWGAVCICNWLAIDLVKNAHPAFSKEEIDLKIKALTLYGLGLGQLSRFSEAHRRLNEAHALLSKSAEGLKGKAFAALNLRRGEVYICQALEAIEKYRLLKQSVTATQVEQREAHRVCVAGLDDAWSALEIAERALSGKSHSSNWWYRLHSVRLDVYFLWGELFKLGHPDLERGGSDFRCEGLAFRRRIRVWDSLQQVFNKGLSLSDGSAFSRLAFLFRFGRAIMALHEGFESMVSEEQAYEALENLEREVEIVEQDLEKMETGELPLSRKLLERIKEERASSFPEAGRVPPTT